MAFLKQGIPEPAPAAPEKAPRTPRPILTLLLYFCGALELLLCLVIALFSLRDKSLSLPTVIMGGAGMVLVALVLFGVGQVVHYLARSAAAAERTAVATEQLAAQREASLSD